jgi:hypothetical protein
MDLKGIGLNSSVSGLGLMATSVNIDIIVHFDHVPSEQCITINPTQYTIYSRPLLTWMLIFQKFRNFGN